MRCANAAPHMVGLCRLHMMGTSNFNSFKNIGWQWVNNVAFLGWLPIVVV